MDKLNCSHEEADTRMLLHTKCVDGPVVIYSDDTDVFILLLGNVSQLLDTYMKVSKGSKSRILNINNIENSLSNKYGSKFSSSLIGLHAFTGCDSVSSFSGKRKNESEKYIEEPLGFCSCL